MSNDQSEYEIFVSYARLDNQPIPEEYPDGWVTALRDQLIFDQRRFTTEPLRIFFDTSEIKDMDDWRHRILGGLRSSKILLICLSPNYFKSGPCKWEWDEYLKRQIHQLMGSESIATIYFVEVPGSSEHEIAKRLDELMRGNFTDIRPWFPAGPRMMQEAEVKRRIEALGLSLWERVDRARRARTVPGNVRRTNPFFVGRREELLRLHEQLGVGAIGVVTTVHGLGGIGKTELVYQYANSFADCFPAGIWSLGAEHKKELLPLLGELAFVPQFGFVPSDAEKSNPLRLGQAVLYELQKRSSEVRNSDPEHGEAVLVILDNVSEAELLSASQLAQLPHPANWLRIVATTRIGPDKLTMSEKQLVPIFVDALSNEDALALIREHLPDQQFSSAIDEESAREIVRNLGGFTLAVEQTAVYLGLNSEFESPSAFLRRWRAEGSLNIDDLPKDADIAAQMLHQQKQLGPILHSTIKALTNEIPAVLRAVQYASVMPPDTVPWPWLKELTTASDSELAEKPSEWGKLKRRLQGSRLLIDGNSHEVARIHRLVATYVQHSAVKTLLEQLEAEIRSLVTNRLEAIKSQRQRIINEVITGDPDQKVTGWNVPSAEEVGARAEANQLVNFYVHSDGSFTVTVKHDANWEEQCLKAFVSKQFAGNSLDGIEWALGIGEVPDRDILDSQLRFVTSDDLPVREDEKGTRIAGLYLLALASAWCRMGSDRVPYQLSQKAVKLFKALSDKFPDDTEIAALLRRSQEKEQMYGWF